MLARIRAYDRGHVLQPAPSGLEDETTDGDLVEHDDLDDAVREPPYLVGAVEPLPLKPRHSDDLPRVRSSIPAVLVDGVAGRRADYDPVPVCGAGPVGREWSAIRNVARETVTSSWQRGHLGVMVLPVTPSRYESAALQCGQGPNHPVAIVYLLGVFGR
jgi:hypothetical protein